MFLGRHVPRGRAALAMRLRPVRFRSSPRSPSITMIAVTVPAARHARMVSERARFDSVWRLDDGRDSGWQCIGGRVARHAPAKRASRFDSRLMLDGPIDDSVDGSIDGSDPGLLNLAAGFDSLASFSGGNTASVRGRDPSFRSSESWFESSQRHRARVVQWSGRRSLNASKRVQFPPRALASLARAVAHFVARFASRARSCPPLRVTISRREY